MKRYPFCHTCPCCGANLDSGERCDCEESGFLTEYTQEEAA